MNKLPHQHLPKNASTREAFWIVHLLITQEQFAAVVVRTPTSLRAFNTAGRILGQSIKQGLCAMEQCSVDLGIWTRATTVFSASTSDNVWSKPAKLFGQVKCHFYYI